MMNHNQRIGLMDTVLSACTKLSEGNIGAVNVLIQLVKQTPTIDPDAAFGGLAPLLDLDMYGIYGSRIWILYKDVCGQDIVKMHAVLRAMQLGLVSDLKVDKAIGDDESRHRNEPLDVDGLLLQVKERLPNFAADVKVAS